MGKKQCNCSTDAVNKTLKIIFSADYQIKAKPGTQNVAYLSSLLQLHTDLPYYHYKPGVSFK